MHQPFLLISIVLKESVSLTVTSCRTYQISIVLKESVFFPVDLVAENFVEDDVFSCPEEIALYLGNGLCQGRNQPFSFSSISVKRQAHCRNRSPLSSRQRQMSFSRMRYMGRMSSIPSKFVLLSLGSIA